MNPASISVTAYSYFFGAIFMVVTAFLMTNESADWNLTRTEAFAVCYAVSSLTHLTRPHSSFHVRALKVLGVR